jgi:hypothetical protein
VPVSVRRKSHSNGMLIRRDYVRRGIGLSPASFTPIQCFNQFLNKRRQSGGVSFVCHRNTKFAPVFAHTVSHIHLRYSGGCLRMLRQVRSMFGATSLSGLVATVLITRHVVSIINPAILRYRVQCIVRLVNAPKNKSVEIEFPPAANWRI